MIFLAFWYDGTGDEGDSVFHFLYSKHAFEHPENFLNHWAKPVFVLITAPVAQFGFIAMKIFNIFLGSGCDSVACSQPQDSFIPIGLGVWESYKQFIHKLLQNNNLQRKRVDGGLKGHVYWGPVLWDNVSGTRCIRWLEAPCEETYVLLVIKFKTRLIRIWLLTTGFEFVL